METKIIRVKLAGYDMNKKLNYLALGQIVDKKIENNLPDGKYILRAIGSQDHPKFTLDHLVSKILELGTDKYDPKRKGVCHEEFRSYDYDIQAGTCEIKNSRLVIDPNSTIQSEFGDIIYHFCEHVLKDRGYAVKIDILLFYDPRFLSIATHNNNNGKKVDENLASYLYKFKDKTKKPQALKAIVIIE